MRFRELFWVQLILGAGSLLFLLLAALFWLQKPVVIAHPIVEKAYPLPKNIFAVSAEEYAAIDEPVLSLAYASPTLQLPDLRQTVVYYGKNGRPDASGSQVDLHLGLAGQTTILSVSPGKPLYLLYDRSLSPPRYVPSPDNAETSLWVEPTPLEKQVSIAVRMRNEKGEILSSPENLAQFLVAERELARQAGSKWELGKWRVDGSLLARQRARWFGADCFLENHGGEEYASWLGKHRIDFGEKEEAYSVFVGMGDCLIWDGTRWKEAVPGPETYGKPLMVVKKIDDRLMHLELWEVEGKSKMAMNLIKSQEPWIYQPLQNDFKFVGARTKSQYVFEIKNERMVLSPDDWLIYVDGQWKKLTAAEEIDDYVNRKLLGPLFIFEKILKREDHQLMVGTMYNKTRTEAQTLEIAIQPGGGTVSARFVPQETSHPSPEVQEIEREDLRTLARDQRTPPAQPKDSE